jgi:hypothetical protein
MSLILSTSNYIKFKTLTAKDLFNKQKPKTLLGKIVATTTIITSVYTSYRIWGYIIDKKEKEKDDNSNININNNKYYLNENDSKKQKQEITNYEYNTFNYLNNIQTIYIQLSMKSILPKLYSKIISMSGREYLLNNCEDDGGGDGDNGMDDGRMNDNCCLDICQLCKIKNNIKNIKNR